MQNRVKSFVVAIACLGFVCWVAAGDPPKRQSQIASSQATSDRANASQEDTNQNIPNAQIDPKAFLSSAQSAMELREKRRLTEEQFLRMSRQKGVVVLDCRTKERYEQAHIQGAVSLPFTEITVDNMAQQLPDKNVTILIYCNNNFRGNRAEFASKSAGSALNLSTFTTLYEYGYHNVYELGPLLDLKTTKLPLVGTTAKLLR